MKFMNGGIFFAFADGENGRSRRGRCTENADYGNLICRFFVEKAEKDCNLEKMREWVWTFFLLVIY